MRPEDIGPAIDGTPLLSGTVSVAEPLGAETLIYVDVADREIIASGPGRTPPTAGDAIGLAGDPDSMHVFDANTGMVVASERAVDGAQ